MRLHHAAAPLCSLTLALVLAGSASLARAEMVSEPVHPAPQVDLKSAAFVLAQGLPDIDLRPAPDARFMVALGCREIMGVIQRLQCYDGAMEGGGGLGRLRLAVGGNAGPAFGDGWVFHRQADPFSGADLSWVRLGRLGDDGQGRVPAEAAPEAVILQCDGNGGFRLLVAGRGFLGAPGEALAVRYRFGAAPSVTESWQVVGDGRIVMMPKAGSDFIAALQVQQDFLFETLSYRGTRAAARFAGAAEAAPGWAHVRAGCPTAVGRQGEDARPTEGPRWRAAASHDGAAGLPAEASAAKGAGGL